MSWHARLDLHYSRASARTVARHRHEGPLRILQSLWPEGESVCHNVLVHPPSGLVGGDVLDIQVRVDAGAHGLITTPGATRFYRSEGALAAQRTRIALEADARLEWLPLEALYYSGCQAHNQLVMDLAPGAELIGWDVAALGLPEAGQPFRSGRLQQHLALEGHWLERGLIDAQDSLLMDGPLGLAGHRCLATLFFACGSDIPRERRELALDRARELIEASALRGLAGATAPQPRVLVVRALAPLVEPAMNLMRSIRAAWRESLWELPANPPRGWAL
ncbi:urease accessory protein UreD [Ramlibacter rhizophilus]|uniref:Urease accessory protein UreD n=1 Tax=Ramlibacter rhizophilus TaxID=1781167 RepID=A0A4Z0BS17_9BURK|nr:urease accessory protein UreD [Ramlibacter rhizophilus]TFZ01220.1 urease accessory protein UreD [Ramlibacter rhizophilus]